MDKLETQPIEMDEVPHLGDADMQLSSKNHFFLTNCSQLGNCQVSFFLSIHSQPNNFKDGIWIERTT